MPNRRHGIKFLGATTLTDSITAFADASLLGGAAGDVRATVAGHTISTGGRVTISGTTNYNGSNRLVTATGPNTFDFTDTWVATETGTVVQTLTPEIHLSEFTKGILHISGIGTRVEVFCSPNGGVSWFILYRPNGVRGRYTLTTALESYQIEILPKHVRMLVDTADCNYVYIEGIREVA